MFKSLLLEFYLIFYDFMWSRYSFYLSSLFKAFCPFSIATWFTRSVSKLVISASRWHLSATVCFSSAKMGHSSASAFSRSISFSTCRQNNILLPLDAPCLPGTAPSGLFIINFVECLQSPLTMYNLKFLRIYLPQLVLGWKTSLYPAQLSHHNIRYGLS